MFTTDGGDDRSREEEGASKLPLVAGFVRHRLNDDIFNGFVVFVGDVVLVLHRCTYVRDFAAHLRFEHFFKSAPEKRSNLKKIEITRISSESTKCTNHLYLMVGLERVEHGSAHQ